MPEDASGVYASNSYLVRCLSQRTGIAQFSEVDPSLAQSHDGTGLPALLEHEGMMRYRLIGLFCGLFVANYAAAQVAESDSLRRAMTEPAAKLLASVAGGPGPIEQMAGFDRRASVAFELADPQRQNWQYWPAARVGLSLELMTSEQRLLAHQLLTAVLSSTGYLKATQIMQLEQILLTTDQAGFPRAVGHYKLVLFGNPSIADDWAWRFEGHHVSLSVTVATQGITVTPSFFGSNPAEVRTGPLAGLRVHGAIEEMGRELVESLSNAEQGRAIIADRAPAEIFSTQVRVDRADWQNWVDELLPQGIAVSSLNELQQEWVRRILNEVIDDYRAEIAPQFHEQINFDELKFAWMGSTERGAPHYFRLQGSDFLYEYDNVQNNGNHVHSVWRSKRNDFGRSVLADHYLSATH